MVVGGVGSVVVKFVCYMGLEVFVIVGSVEK